VKFSEFVGSSMTNQCFKFGGIRSTGSEVPVFKLRGHVFARNFHRPLAANYMSDPKKVLEFQNSTELLYHCVKYGGSRTSCAAKRTEKFDVFLFFVTFLNGKVYLCTQDRD